MQENFLLSSPEAVSLYRDTASSLPVIDYHNHLNVSVLNENRRAENITALWLDPDPYKHRLLRALGVDEAYITGSADDKTKFFVWCEHFSLLLGTPVYQWSLMELQQVFHTSLLPSKETAPALWEELNAKIPAPDALLDGFNCETLCPCSGLFDDLTAFGGRLKPSWRLDNMVDTLSVTAQKANVQDCAGFLRFMQEKIQAFHEAGCRFADHSLDDAWRFLPDDGKNDERFLRVLQGETPNNTDKQHLESYLLLKLFAMYRRKNWTVQLHIGALRRTSDRLKRLAGAAGGFAGIGNTFDVTGLAQLFNCAEEADGLPSVVLFTLNPAYNEAFSILSGSFARPGVRGLVTQGPAWWWCDHEPGIRQVLETVSVYGVLSNFPGMTTDSRSLLSFVRHDYFRRILCSFVTEKFGGGQSAEKLIRLLCYENAKERMGG